ncbi:transcription termination factor Rho [Egicoccus sp. AB-alg6-2]|uniref:transcription termination factor Rho n=1 Tax=Egicoccus sp. AB-alg6-2 TaxID=3242692 RepID=UPI00359D298C
MDRSTLERKALAELRQIASALELKGYQRMKKADLVDLIIDAGQAGAPSAGNGAAAESTAPPAAAADSAAPAAAQQPELSADGDRGESETSEGSGRVRARQRPTDRPFRARENDRDTGDGNDRARERRDDDQRSRTRDDDRDERGRGDDRDERGRGDDRDDRGRGDQRNDDDGDDGGRGKRDRRRKGRGGANQDNYDDAEVREGILDLLPEGYGFLRCTGYLSGSRDVYVSQSFVRRFDLRRGDRVSGPIRRNKNNDKFPALARIDAIEGESVDEGALPRKRVEFKDLTPLFPDERLKLEVEENSPIAMRIVDMMAPIGRGQRGLIVSPPKAGKTSILKQLAAAIEVNNPDVHLMVVLVDERPEEVTDFERSTGGEVISSTFDRPAEDHTQVAELAIERAKRLVEAGRDVVVLLDSITRLGRAYNLAAPASGRVLSGGIDSAALYPPKRFFGAARNIEDGGSLTIIATALIETGSKMDEVIFEEFKGTGNMELRLDRRMEQKRIFPAVDIQASGTRREDLLLPRDQIETVWKLRRLLSSMDSEAALHLLIEKLRATKNNAQFLQMISKSNLS